MIIVDLFLIGFIYFYYYVTDLLKKQFVIIGAGAAFSNFARDE